MLIITSSTLSELDPASPYPAAFHRTDGKGEGSELFRKHHISGQVLRDGYCVAAGSTNYVNAATVPRKLLPSRLRRRDWPYHAV